MSGAKFTVLDNSNVVESYPGITLPLTYSFIKLAYKGAFKGVIGASLKNDAILSKFDDVFDNMISSYQGRIYYSINNWYSLIDFMPFSKKIIPIWQDMMGVHNTEVYLGKQHDFTATQKAKLYWNMLKNSFHIPRDMGRLADYFKEVSAYFENTYSPELSNKELLSLFREIDVRLLDKWHITLSNDMYAFIWTGLLKKSLKKKGVDVTKYISGISSLESLKPIKQLLNIAEKYGGDKDLLSNPEVQEYLKVYGDRSPLELKLEVMTYRENPLLLVEKIREYAADKEKLQRMIRNLERHDFEEEQRGFILKRAKLGILNREISRLNRSRIYGMVRRIFCQIGVNLQREAYIDEPFDVFYLTIEEIEKGNYSDFKEKISERKAEFAAYGKSEPHTRIVLSGDKIIDTKTAEKWQGSYMGIGTSVGSVTAEAVVLESPNEKADVRGKIIVTKTTDPGWVFLLTMASGIIAEKGSLLSHTAIVSRELGIPAVVAVESATAVIKTGDIVKIDGDTGRVELVQAN